MEAFMVNKRKYNFLCAILLIFFVFSLSLAGCNTDISDLHFEVPSSAQAYYNTYYEVPQYYAVDGEGNLYKASIEVYNSKDEKVNLSPQNAFLINDYSGYTIKYTVEYKNQTVTKTTSISVIDNRGPQISLKNRYYIVDPESNPTFSIPAGDITVTDDITKTSQIKLRYKVTNGDETYDTDVNEFENDFKNGSYYTVLIEALDGEGNKNTASFYVLSNNFGFEDDFYYDLIFGYNDGNWNQIKYEIKEYGELGITANPDGGQKCLQYSSVMNNPGSYGVSYADFILYFKQTLIKGTKISFDFYCQKPPFTPQCSLLVGKPDTDRQFSILNEVASFKTVSDFDKWQTFEIVLLEDMDSLEFEVLVEQASGDATLINYYIDNIKIDLIAANEYGPEITVGQKTYIVAPGRANQFTIPVGDITVTDNITAAENITVNYKVYYVDELVTVTDNKFDIDFSEGGYYNIIIEATDEHQNKTTETIQVITTNIDFEYGFYKDMIYGYLIGEWPKVEYDIKKYSDIGIAAPDGGGESCLEYSPSYSNPPNNNGDTTYSNFIIYFGDEIPEGATVSFMYYYKKPSYSPDATLKVGPPDLEHEFGDGEEYISRRFYSDTSVSGTYAFDTWHVFSFELTENISALEFELHSYTKDNDGTQIRLYIDNISFDYTNAYTVAPRITVPQESYVLNPNQIVAIPVDEIIITDNMTKPQDMKITYKVYYKGSEITLGVGYTFNASFVQGGFYKIVIRAEDEDGNAAEAIIRVLPNIAGITQGPEIDCPDLFLIGDDDETFTIPDITITDNHTGAEDITVTYEVYKGGEPVELSDNTFDVDFSDGIIYTLIIRAEDEHENVTQKNVAIVKESLGFGEAFVPDIYGYLPGNWNEISYAFKQYGELDIPAPDGRAGSDKCMEYSPVMSNPGGDGATYADFVINLGGVLPQGTKIKIVYYFKKPDYNPECSFKAGTPDLTKQFLPEDEIAKFGGDYEEALALDEWHSIDLTLNEETDAIEFEMFCITGASDGTQIRLYVDSIQFVVAGD